MRAKKLVLLVAPALLLALLAGPMEGAKSTVKTRRLHRTHATARAQGPKIDPQALAILRKSADYVASLPRFTVRTQVTREVIYPSGIVIDSDRTNDVSVERPNHLRADIRSGMRNVQVFYDGRNLTLFTPKRNLYGTVPAGSTIDQTIKQAEDRWGVDFPAAEFLFQNPYQVMVANVRRAAYVGPSLVNGVMTDQVAFRNKDLDWQLWVAQGDTPVPVRLAITDRAVKGNPRFMVTMTDWNTSPQFSSDTFAFVPPEGAKQITVMDMSKLRAQARARQLARR